MGLFKAIFKSVLPRFRTAVLLSTASIAFSLPAMAVDNILHVTLPVQTDRPTMATLGVKLPFTGDNNGNSSVALQYRASGDSVWSSGLPLYRVHPEVSPKTAGVALAYAGSIFDLRANTGYDIQLTISDADGVVDQTGRKLPSPATVILSGISTRGIPGDPATPNVVNVSTAAQLAAALANARAGDVIMLAPGTYTGNFRISASGTAQNPIVIRGSNSIGVDGSYADSTKLDGNNCTGCNILEVYGSYTHVEWLTLQHATRAMRSFNATTANVYRRLHTWDTEYGHTGSNTGAAQTDFVFADNILEGRLAWPNTCKIDTSCQWSSVDGIALYGHGHVVAHNRLSGFGDAIANWFAGARSLDIYGNDVVWNYDDAVELDRAHGNIRFFRNRVANTWEGVSFQPVYGGPAYIFRNVGINVQNENLKIHPNRRDDPSGFLVYNNTFVSNSFGHAWNNQTGGGCHYFDIQNNLFAGPVPLGANEVDVTCSQDHGNINYNGYNSDGRFAFKLNGAYQSFGTFADLQARSPLEHDGQLLTVPACGSVFTSCLVAPGDNSTFVQPQDVTPDSASGALDKALVLPNVNDKYTGGGPDIGAVEAGCRAPVYGPRPLGVDESTAYSCQ